MVVKIGGSLGNIAERGNPEAHFVSGIPADFKVPQVLLVRPGLDDPCDLDHLSANGRPGVAGAAIFLFEKEGASELVFIQGFVVPEQEIVDGGTGDQAVEEGGEGFRGVFEGNCRTFPKGGFEPGLVSWDGGKFVNDVLFSMSSILSFGKKGVGNLVLEFVRPGVPTVEE